MPILFRPGGIRVRWVGCKAKIESTNLFYKVIFIFTSVTYWN